MLVYTYVNSSMNLGRMNIHADHVVTIQTDVYTHKAI